MRRARSLQAAPFTSTVVGSMPRPPFVRDLMARKLAGEDVDAAIDNAVRYVISMQEAAGVEIVSDGEWRRLSYIGIIADICRGFERGDRDGRSWHVVVDPIEVVRPGIIAEEARFLLSATGARAKVALPSPYLLGERMWDPERSKAAYPTRRTFTEALVPVLREELRALQGLGLAFAQFDDPHICLFVDPAARAQHADPEEEVGYACDLLRRVVEPFPDLPGDAQIPVGLHLCRRNRGRAGWAGEGGYGPLLPHLRRLPIDLYLLEFAIPAAGDFEVLQEIPADRSVGLGCVDCRSAHIDTPEEIATRVEKALAHLPPERVLLNPDCGFAPGSAADIPLDEAYAKLVNETRASALLRERLRKA
jgi:5-methyltetrahydropteroyltriglutamate--homocysteine methyltransferase